MACPFPAPDRPVERAPWLPQNNGALSVRPPSQPLAQQMRAPREISRHPRLDDSSTWGVTSRHNNEHRKGQLPHDFVRSEWSSGIGSDRSGLPTLVAGYDSRGGLATPMAIKQTGDQDIKALRGTKRTCQNPECGSRFYDLNRQPITCPACGAVYELALKAPQAPPSGQPSRSQAKRSTAQPIG